MRIEKALWRVRTTEEQEENVDRTHDILVKLHNATINEIYDDRKKEICSNCKVFRASLTDKDGYCPVVKGWFKSSFGCNEWKVK